MLAVIVVSVTTAIVAALLISRNRWERRRATDREPDIEMGILGSAGPSEAPETETSFTRFDETSPKQRLRRSNRVNHGIPPSRYIEVY